MAKETVTRLVDDLDGSVAHETVSFGLDGHRYEIDLSSKNAKRLRTELASFIEHGTKVSRRSASGGRGHRARSLSGNRDQNQAIREWAQRKGYEVAARGRIRQDVVDEYQKAAGR